MDSPFDSYGLVEKDMFLLYIRTIDEEGNDFHLGAVVSTKLRRNFIGYFHDSNYSLS